jgi:hypothetical protein
MFQEETDCMEHCKVGTAYFEIMEQNNHPSLGLSRLSFFFHIGEMKRMASPPPKIGRQGSS